MIQAQTKSIFSKKQNSHFYDKTSMKCPLYHILSDNCNNTNNIFERNDPYLDMLERQAFISIIHKKFQIGRI